MWSIRSLVPVVLFVSTAAYADDLPGALKPFGLERRIPWNDLHIVGSPDPILPYKVVRAFPKLTIKQPLCLTPEPGTNRLFVLQHLNFWAGPGRLLAVNDDQAASETEVLLEIDGLAVGIAFHPDYTRNGFLYIGLNGPMNGSEKMTKIVRYKVGRQKPRGIDAESKRLIVEWASNGHNGGDLAFGNDGFLYVSSGDGSTDSDGNLTGQTIDDLLGAVLRIDVDHPDVGRNYGIPKDNPFVNRPGAAPSSGLMVCGIPGG